jgi:hypothetical protein
VTEISRVFIVRRPGQIEIPYNNPRPGNAIRQRGEFGEEERFISMGHGSINVGEVQTAPIRIQPESRGSEERVLLFVRESADIGIPGREDATRSPI